MITRRNFILGLSALAAPMVLRAEQYPARPITMVVGFSPGGGTDVTARIVSTRMSELLGQSIVVENKPGAAGTLAVGQIERAPADGYSILLNASGAFIHSILKSDFNYKPLEVSTPIAAMTKTPIVMLVNNSLPVNSVEEFVDLAKKKEFGVSYGSDGVAGTTQLCGEYFSTLAGIKLLHVPFKGAGQSVVATVGGQVDSNFPTLPSALSMIRAGKVKPLAVSGMQRSSMLPDIPTFDELGYEDFDFLCWFGLIGPKGIPADVVHKLNDVTQNALRDPEVQRSIHNQGMEPMFGSADEWLEFMGRDAQNIERMARVSNLEF